MIRPANAGDLPEITAIYAHHVSTGCSSFELAVPDLAEMTSRFLAVQSAGLPYLAAESDGRVLGYAYAAPYRPRQAYRFTVENSIYLSPDAMRQGIGTALLSELISRCAALGICQMIAVIGDSGNAASVALHAKLGFRNVGTLERVGYKFDRWVDTVLMQRGIA